MVGGALKFICSFSIGGQGPSPSTTYRAINESWNGSNWTEVNDLNTGRQDLRNRRRVLLHALASGGGTPWNSKIKQNYGMEQAWTEVA